MSSAPVADPVFARAAEFVATGGSATDRALAAALCGAGAPLAVAAAVESELCADGGLPGADEEARLAATARALRAIDQLGLLAHPVSDRLAGFLVSRQRDDGSFGLASEAPARIPLSAAVGAALARVASVRLSVLQGVERFVMAQWDVARVQGGSEEAKATVLAVFELVAGMPSELSDEVLQWCGRELERGYRAGAFSALEAARVFIRCGADALPGTRLVAADVLPGVLAGQHDDGSFGATGAPLARRIHDTLDALVAIARLRAE